MRSYYVTLTKSFDEPPPALTKFAKVVAANMREAVCKHLLNNPELVRMPYEYALVAPADVQLDREGRPVVSVQTRIVKRRAATN